MKSLASPDPYACELTRVRDSRSSRGTQRIWRAGGASYCKRGLPISHERRNRAKPYSATAGRTAHPMIKEFGVGPTTAQRLGNLGHVSAVHSLVAHRGMVMVDMDAAEARRALGRELAAARRAAGYVQEALAQKVRYSRSTIANVETGRQSVDREFWVRCEAVLGTDLAQRYDRLEQAVVAAADAKAVVRFARRVVAAGGIESSVLLRIEADVRRLVERRHVCEPSALGHDIRTLRDYVIELVGHTRQPTQLGRLYLVTARLCQLLSYMCVSLGLESQAQAHAYAALRIAQAAGHRGVYAWLRSQNPVWLTRERPYQAGSCPSLGSGCE